MSLGFRGECSLRSSPSVPRSRFCWFSRSVPYLRRLDESGNRIQSFCGGERGKNVKILEGQCLSTGPRYRQTNMKPALAMLADDTWTILDRAPFGSHSDHKSSIIFRHHWTDLGHWNHTIIKRSCIGTRLSDGEEEKEQEKVQPDGSNWGTLAQ